MARPVLSGVDELVTQQDLMTPEGVSAWSKIDKVVDGLVAANELPKLVTPKPGARERTITVQNADVKLKPWLGTRWIVRVYVDVRWLHEVPLVEARERARHLHALVEDALSVESSAQGPHLHTLATHVDVVGLRVTEATINRCWPKKTKPGRTTKNGPKLLECEPGAFRGFAHGVAKLYRKDFDLGRPRNAWLKELYVMLGYNPETDGAIWRAEVTRAGAELAKYMANASDPESLKEFHETGMEKIRIMRKKRGSRAQVPDPEFDVIRQLSLDEKLPFPPRTAQNSGGVSLPQAHGSLRHSIIRIAAEAGLHPDRDRARLLEHLSDVMDSKQAPEELDRRYRKERIRLGFSDDELAPGDSAASGAENGCPDMDDAPVAWGSPPRPFLWPAERTQPAQGCAPERLSGQAQFFGLECAASRRRFTG